MITGIYQKSLPYRLLENIRDAAGRFIFNYSLIKRGIEGVEILRVKAVGGQAEGFTEMAELNEIKVYNSLWGALFYIYIILTVDKLKKLL